MDDSIPGLSQKNKSPRCVPGGGPRTQPKPPCAKDTAPPSGLIPRPPSRHFPNICLPPSPQGEGFVRPLCTPPRQTAAFLPRHLKMGFKLLPLPEPLPCRGLCPLVCLGSRRTPRRARWRNRPPGGGREGTQGWWLGSGRAGDKPSLSAQPGPHSSILLGKGTVSVAIPGQGLFPRAPYRTRWVGAGGSGRPPLPRRGWVMT